MSTFGDKNSKLALHEPLNFVTKMWTLKNSTHIYYKRANQVEKEHLLGGGNKFYQL